MKTNQYQTPIVEVSWMSVTNDILDLASSSAGLEDYNDTNWDWGA